MYEVAAFNWGTASADGALLSTINFPDSLFQLPFILTKLAGFAAFKADVEIEVRMNSNSFVYGKLMCAVQPCGSGWDSALTGPPQLTIARQFGVSTMPHAILDPSAPEVLKLTIPWMWAYPSVDLRAYPPACIGSLFFVVLNQLRCINSAVASPNVPVVVYARFKNVSLMCPIPSSVAVAPGFNH